MARLARVVIPGLPHHVTQRGNRRERTFFNDDDYALYLDLLAEAALRAHTEVWCYCLMPNHVHIVLVPSDEDGLRRTFGDAYQRYQQSGASALRAAAPRRFSLSRVRRNREYRAVAGLAVGFALLALKVVLPI